jgi:hypothetical protein
MLQVGTLWGFIRFHTIHIFFARGTRWNFIGYIKLGRFCKAYLQAFIEFLWVRVYLARGTPLGFHRARVHLARSTL